MCSSLDITVLSVPMYTANARVTSCSEVHHFVLFTTSSDAIQTQRILRTRLLPLVTMALAAQTATAHDTVTS